MAEDIWTVKAALDWTVGYLERKGDEAPLLSAQWLLSEATGLTRIELYMNYDRPLSPDERGILRDYVARRGKGEPLQYITGEVGFRHITVKVRPGVLIPRPETEVLVSEVLAALPEATRPRSAEFLAEVAGVERGLVADERLADAERSARDEKPTHGGESGRAEELVVAEKPSLTSERAAEVTASETNVSRETFVSSFADYSEEPSRLQTAASVSREEREKLLVADICTGSGCIACSIAFEHPDACVIATDIASDAIALARENAAQLGLEDRVRVISSDLGEGVPARYEGRFDAVVSNPPYVPTVVLSDIPREVAAFEPALALDGGQDGLDLFRRLLPWTMRALKSGGVFGCELHETCLDEAAELARAAGFVNVRIVYDLAGKPRVLTALKA